MPSRLGAFVAPAPAGLPAAATAALAAAATVGRLPATAATGRRVTVSPAAARGVGRQWGQLRRGRGGAAAAAWPRPPRRTTPPVAVLPGVVVATPPLVAAAAASPPAVASAVAAQLSAAVAAAPPVDALAPLLLAFTDPWSISAATADAVAAQLFAASLFPYLAFLYYLSRPEAGCPKGAFRGFAFLLVFVFATIPAGIYAKVVVGDILANVDWLHGSAESLLTVTNLLIVGGFRAALTSVPSGTAGAAAGETPAAAGDTSTAAPSAATPAPAAAVGGGGEALAAAVITAGVVAIAVAGGTSAHVEPANALSLPTWAIHVSSVAEWLIAMGLAWRYAAVSGNEAWKGLAWGMVPLHASGIAACVFHAAYNSPAVGGLVAVQAGLTVIGNTTCAFAAARVARRGRALAEAAADPTAKTATATAGAAAAAPAAAAATAVSAGVVEAPAVFWAKVVGGSVAGAAVVKWGELWLDGAFHPTLPVAVAAVVVPTVVNAASWAARGARERAAAAEAAAAGGAGAGQT